MSFKDMVKPSVAFIGAKYSGVYEYVGLSKVFPKSFRFPLLFS